MSFVKQAQLYGSMNCFEQLTALLPEHRRHKCKNVKSCVQTIFHFVMVT